MSKEGGCAPLFSGASFSQPQMNKIVLLSKYAEVALQMRTSLPSAHNQANPIPHVPSGRNLVHMVHLRL